MNYELTDQEIGMILSALDHVPTVGLDNFELAVAIKNKLTAGKKENNNGLSGKIKGQARREQGD